MKVLVADDDLVSRIAVEAALREWGFEAMGCADGASAWEHLRDPDGPQLALLDWLMPGMDGLEICRQTRQTRVDPRYLILLTARDTQADLIACLSAGADDYVAKPFDREELRLRIRAGQRILDLQSNLADRVHELEESLARVRELQGILPICSYCKKVRSDQNYWQQVENYLASHIDVRFSHGICPECYSSRVQPELERLQSSLAPPPDATGSGI